MGGLWDVIDCKNAMTECRRSLRKNGDVNEAAKKLINLAQKLSNQSTLDSPNQNNNDGPPLTSDNISVMVIGFANKDKETGKEHIGPKMEELKRPNRRRRKFGGFSRKTSI